MSEIDKETAEKTMRYIGYNERGFQELKAGDVVVIRFGLKKRRTVCTGNAFYNNDADEPGWEVETENTFLSVDNDIWVQTPDESLVSSEEIKNE